MSIRIIEGDCRDVLRTMPENSVHCVVTSPPYWGLRDYGVDGQLGLEATYQEHVVVMADIFDEVRRVLRDDGTLWLNYGDSYATSPNGRSAADTKATGKDDRTFRDKPFSTIQGVLKPKDLCGIPWRVAFALQERGWYLRQDIIWSKPNPMPESVQDRCTKAHEYIFMLSKSARYYYDIEAIKEPMSLSSVDRLSQDVEAQTGSNRVPGKTNGTMKAVGKVDKQRGHGRRHAGFNDRWDAMERAEQCTGMRNKRSVWEVATQPFSEAHFATFPPSLIEPCIKAGCPSGGIVLDPFGGAGTTGLVADRLQRNAILIELNPAYAEIARKRLSTDAGMFAEVA
jgi:DNA modification methylase